MARKHLRIDKWVVPHKGTTDLGGLVPSTPEPPVLSLCSLRPGEAEACTLPVIPPPALRRKAR